MQDDGRQLVLGREATRRVDQRAIDEYGMHSLVLMENAGRGLADRLEELGINGPVAICCGSGNNAGDGFVTARHLEYRGHDARVVLLIPPSRFSHDAKANFNILAKAGTPITDLSGDSSPVDLAHHLAGVDWVVDALLGTGARGEPRPPLSAAIDAINQSSGKKLAVDVPSGLDCETGEPSHHTVRADHTCTFVAMKRGFLLSHARPYVGSVHVADIGVPRALLQNIANEGSGYKSDR